MFEAFVSTEWVGWGDRVWRGAGNVRARYYSNGGGKKS